MPQGNPEGYAAPFNKKKLSESLRAKGKKMAVPPGKKGKAEARKAAARIRSGKQMLTAPFND